MWNETFMIINFSKEREGRIKKKPEKKTVSYNTSASNTILLPSGQIIWSTWVLTFSHVRSEVLKLAWKPSQKSITT